MRAEKHMQMMQMQNCVIEKYVSHDEYEELVKISMGIKCLLNFIRMRRTTKMTNQFNSRTIRRAITNTKGL